MSEEDIAFAKTLETSWGALYQTSLFRGNTLEQTKDKFSKLNVVEIANFLRELDEFVEKFDKEGPATVDQDFDLGLVLMEVSVKPFLLSFILLRIIICSSRYWIRFSEKYRVK